MNEQMEEFARSKILEGLKKLPESNQLLFKRMYSHKNLDASIEDAVRDMAEDRLGTAMDQIGRTLKENN